MPSRIRLTSPGGRARLADILCKLLNLLCSAGRDEGHGQQPLAQRGTVPGLGWAGIRVALDAGAGATSRGSLAPSCRRDVTPRLDGESVT